MVPVTIAQHSVTEAARADDGSRLLAQRGTDRVPEKQRLHRDLRWTQFEPAGCAPTIAFATSRYFGLARNPIDHVKLIVEVLPHFINHQTLKQHPQIRSDWSDEAARLTLKAAAARKSPARFSRIADFLPK